MITADLPRRALPPMARVRQRLSSEHVPEVRKETRERLLAAGLRDKVKSRDRIAITAGSRGMGGFLELLGGIVDAVKIAGAVPIVIPAMGSHGGATAEGQARLLGRLGVSEQAVGAPIQATMETRALGGVRTGAVAHVNAVAAQADGIIVLGRIKTHPENAAGVASGLLKMTTVGLGNQIGAQEAHSNGLWDSVRQVPEITLSRCNVLFGVAVVENAFRAPVAIEVVPGTYEAFLDVDRRLLEKAALHVAKLPFKQLDLLIVDELGKTISGTGMDLNVIGKWRMNGGAREPDYFRIVALSLTHGSMGNALGIGLSDFTTQRLLHDYDPLATYINLLTASEPGVMNTREGLLPLALGSDREAIEVALYSSLAGGQPRVCRIKNTTALDEFSVSDALLPEVEQNSALALAEVPRPIPFDNRGNLL